jgi:hypothetical protein
MSDFGPRHRSVQGASVTDLCAALVLLRSSIKAAGPALASPNLGASVSESDPAMVSRGP